MSIIFTQNLTQEGGQRQSNSETAVLFADGGSRGNPGASAFGYVVYKLNEDQDKLIKNFTKLSGFNFESLVDDFVDKAPFWADGRFIGVATNNQAEWGGLLGGLKWIKENMQEIRVVIIYLDSELVVKQLRGEYRIKNPELAIIANQVKEVLTNFKGFQIFHIPREKNKLADKIVNQKMDQNS
jgi:ribonuclease HI